MTSGGGTIKLSPSDPPEVQLDRAAWQKLICSSDLPASARLVALALSVYTDASGQQGVWFTATDLARATGIRTLTTVNHYARMLLEAGYLRKHDGAWFLIFPGAAKCRG